MGGGGGGGGGGKDNQQASFVCRFFVRLLMEQL